MILRLFMHLSIRVVCFTNSFPWVTSDSKHSTAVEQKVMLCRELVNIYIQTLGTLG